MVKNFLAITGVLSVLGSGLVYADGLYNEADYKPLISDARALRVGDKLTVIVTEFASVTANARTATDKDGAISGSILSPGSGTNRVGAINLNEDFNGGGRIERSGKLVAQLTVVVQALEANGDLLVKGQQDISVNNEVQVLSIEGRVRPQDIGANNTVPSTRISDAKINYTGEGLLAEKQRPGVLTRFLSWLRIL